MKALLLLLALGSQASVANDYLQAKNTLENAPASIKKAITSAPPSYNFESQFNRNSSVSYSGQMFRQVLISDIKNIMSSQKRGSYAGTLDEAKNMLMSFYNYNENTTLSGAGVIDGFSEFKVAARGLNRTPMQIEEGFVYSDIQSPGKNLYKKMAGIDNPLRRSKLFGTTLANTPNELIEVFLSKYANNAVNGKSFVVPNGVFPEQTVTGAHTTEDGVDLAQLTQKFLHGAVSYSQTARDYFSTDLGANKGLNADNTKPAKQGASYTAMEHHFDEGFGYFGAARDFSLYADIEARTGQRDSNEDNFISILKEMNLGISTNTSRFDLTAADGKVNLSKEAIDAFLRGRHLIKTKPEGYKTYVVAQAKVALGVWEKTLGAVTIHYINKSLSSMESYGTSKYLFANFAKYWSEMKGYAYAFQFNPRAILSDSDFDKMHTLLRDAPELPHSTIKKVESYKKDLLAARSILANAFGFSKVNVEKW
jgi:hypothetical protein